MLVPEFSVVGGTAQLTSDGIDEMVRRKHDLEFQLCLCRQIMACGTILPFPFERAVVLLRKAGRLEEELELCTYVKSYCENAEKSWDGWSATIWKSPKLQKGTSIFDRFRDRSASYTA